MQTKGNKKLQNIFLSEIMQELIDANGGKASVCRKLGFEGKDVIKRESVKLSHYEKGESRPKGEFLELWKSRIGDDILELERQRKVSRGTKKELNITRVTEPALKKKDPEEEIRILIRNLDRMGATNEYLLKRVRELGG